MKWETVRRPRALTPDEATELVGVPVEAMPGNVDAPTIVVDADTGAPALAYLPVPDTGALRRAVRSLDYGAGASGGQLRADGLRVRSRTFGYAPRRPVYRQDGCRVTALDLESPDASRTVMAYATRLRAVLEAVAPAVTGDGVKAMTDVAEDWRLGESEWTSGVINASARLPYHRDAMNFPVWSAMPVLRRHMDGGHLHVPEYGLVLPCRDGWGVFFPGYALVHGVTPMRATRPDGYRFSLVYYALRGMQDCFTYAVEREYARTRRTTREQDIARKLADGEPPFALTGGLPPGRPESAYGREDVRAVKAARLDRAAALADGEGL